MSEKNCSLARSIFLRIREIKVLKVAAHQLSYAHLHKISLEASQIAARPFDRDQIDRGLFFNNRRMARIPPFSLLPAARVTEN